MPNLRPTADPRTDVARLEHRATTLDAARSASALELQSVAWPLTGIALLLPLTLHFAVAWGGSASDVHGTVLDVMEDFDDWIQVSLVCVGHAHLVFAAMCWRFARRIRDDAHVPVRHAWLSGIWAVCASALAAVIPTVIFAPPVVLVTGVVPGAVLFAYAYARVRSERAALALTVTDWI